MSKPRVGAFLVALLLLAVIGAAVGWIAGVRVADARDSATGTREPDPPRGDPCPSAAESAAAEAGSPGGLVEILYIRTEDDRQVWICRDTAGTIFYQGYVGPIGGDLRPGENALFLTTVENTDDGYLATNETDDGRTTYHVTSTALTQSNDGNQSTYEVVERRP
ncbi:hypothetical protein O7635_00310 [Asanoa sp. WMMD1127]|uniref:hypothetical protein n=1 Tax=Asanoa sp. WMMD1127 TaxID=3016107 RepID=UPI0024174305|nr:hypothetical protein [Asanoa sp. WMMD1127]MDG4820314.1 hypothetical protein [Asanoa sp. WMMD1127]